MQIHTLHTDYVVRHAEQILFFWIKKQIQNQSQKSNESACSSFRETANNSMPNTKKIAFLEIKPRSVDVGKDLQIAKDPEL